MKGKKRVSKSLNSGRKKLFHGNKLILLLVAVVLAFAAVNFVIVLGKLPLEVKELEVSFEVAGKSGVDLNSSALTFGKVVAGHVVERKVNLVNSYSFPIQVSVTFSDEISEYFLAPEKTVIEPGVEEAISIVLTVSRDEGFASHKGTAFFEIRKLGG